MYGILCMCTSYKRTFKSVAGETRKLFSTLSGEMKNGLASNYKNTKHAETS